jgi:alkanesulfonate monooxygenase SsuD/methylene tetrahydromethanopterin reductase-like flavin-dependent oxidoreductase (luciferase family)
MSRTAVELGRDPASVKISITSATFLGEDEAEYREVLGAAAAARDVSPNELEQRLTDRRLLHGAFDKAAETIAQYEKEGVGRIYFQQYAPLSEVDAGMQERLLKALGG